MAWLSFWEVEGIVRELKFPFEFVMKGNKIVDPWPDQVCRDKLRNKMSSWPELLTADMSTVRSGSEQQKDGKMFPKNLHVPNILTQKHKICVCNTSNVCVSAQVQ